MPLSPTAKTATLTVSCNKIRKKTFLAIITEILQWIMADLGERGTVPLNCTELIS